MRNSYTRQHLETLSIIVQLLLVCRFSVVGGGAFNSVHDSGNLSCVSGGAWNVVTGAGAVIGGGTRNLAAAA